MRFVPVLVLLLLAPFVGEYLLGNITATPTAWAVSLLPLMLLYGGGALLIREVTRRLGRGYPTMLVLAVAYGLLEEGIVLGTLFNRDYLGLGLLEYGWVPQLGTSPVWALYVLGIHSVWSILVPIVLTEHLFPATGGRPWLGVPGTVVAGLVYLVGATLVGLGSYYTYRFLASPAQLLTVAALAVVFIVIALLIRPSPQPSQPGPSAPQPGAPQSGQPGPGSGRAGRVAQPGHLAAVTLLCGSGFILSMELGNTRELVPAPITVGLMIAMAVVAGVAVLASSRRAGWSSAHALGALTGAVATYCWAGFLVQFSVHGFSTVGLLAQLAFVAAAAGLLTLAWRRALLQPGLPEHALASSAWRRGWFKST